MEVIRVIVKRPEQPAVIEIIEKTNQAVKEILQGGMECWSLSEDVAIYCNNESLYNGMPFNCKVEDWKFYGSIVLLKFDENGDYDSFTEEEAIENLKLFI